MPRFSPPSAFSHRVEFGDDEHADRLIKARAHTQALLVWAPVQAGDWLSGQRDVLQQADAAGHPHVSAVGIFLCPLGGILAGNNAILR